MIGDPISNGKGGERGKARLAAHCWARHGSRPWHDPSSRAAGWVPVHVLSRPIRRPPGHQPSSGYGQGPSITVEIDEAEEGGGLPPIDSIWSAHLPPRAGSCSAGGPRAYRILTTGLSMQAPDMSGPVQTSSVNVSFSPNWFDAAPA